MSEVEAFETNPQIWEIDGNLVDVELDVKEDYTLYKSTILSVPVTYSNILRTNVANAGEDGTTTGFAVYNGSTISVSTTWSAQGSRSIKVVTNGSQADQGVITSSTYEAISPNETYTEQVRIKGTGTFGLYLTELNSSLGIVGASSSATITITPEMGEATIYLTRAMGATGAFVRSRVSAIGTLSTTFYVDRFMINAGTEAYPWIPGQTTSQSVLPIVGDTCIKFSTPGAVHSEGIMENPYSVDVNAGDSLWHSVYLRGSGTVILQVVERDNSGAIVRTVNSSPITLTNPYQLVELNTIISTGVLCSFKVITNSIQTIPGINLNGVYVNKGSTSRTGVNLVAENVQKTGANGTADGFVGQNNAVVSAEPFVPALEMSYNAA